MLRGSRHCRNYTARGDDPVSSPYIELNVAPCSMYKYAILRPRVVLLLSLKMFLSYHSLSHSFLAYILQICAALQIYIRVCVCGPDVFDYYNIINGFLAARPCLAPRTPAPPARPRERHLFLCHQRLVSQPVCPMADGRQGHSFIHIIASVYTSQLCFLNLRFRGACGNLFFIANMWNN